ncbi:AAA family ATPase [Bifidobacterium samirii]|uniref:AAA family ATPase n=1 Tax=Bifidobacterium samirii TaxID=2306974 RepID=UPI001F49F5AB|nr:AAA family ATPase [Bifidobacterium samirii]
MEAESLIILDEPELHLHPNAISYMMKSINELLERFNCYAIVATHSPLILQELRSDSILVLTRCTAGEDVFLSVRRPRIECFGNNISAIISDVFEVRQSESLFQDRLHNLVHEKKMSYEEITSLFDGMPLSFNARTLLGNLYKED